MERIGDEVQRELGRSGSRDAVPLAALVTAWPSLVGESIARNAWPLRLGRDDTLHVATSSATWAFELDRMAPEILERIRSGAHETAVSKLRFAVGPLPEPAPADEPRERAVVGLNVPPEVTREADAAASAIDDPELRELVARAARASLARAVSDRDF